MKHEFSESVSCATLMTFKSLFRRDMSQMLLHTEPRKLEADFFLEQAAACRAIARLQVHPAHRATFLRLALHWRTVAHSIGELVVTPADRNLAA